MDDQRTDREGGVETPSIRFGLRPLLLLVALASVIAALIATDIKSAREDAEYQLYRREAWLSQAIEYDPTDPGANALRQELDQVRIKLGKTPTQKNNSSSTR